MSAPTVSQPWPTGYSAPETVISTDDHSAYVSIAAALGLSVALVSCAIRLFIRTSMNRRFGIDDTCLLFATLLAILQSVAVFLAVSKGFGKSNAIIKEPGWVDVQKAVYAAELLYVETVYAAKISVNLLLIRLEPEERMIRALRGLLVFSITTSIVSILFISLRCSLNRPWLQYNHDCSGLIERWNAIAAFDIAIEVFLFALCFVIFFGLNMPVLRKIKVLGVFAFRLGIIPIAIIRLAYVRAAVQSTNPNLDGVFAVLWTQISMNYSLVAASIPVLQPFMSAVSTHYGAMGHNSRNTVGSSALKKLSNLSKGSRRSSNPDRPSHALEKVPSSRTRQKLLGSVIVYRGDHAATAANFDIQGDDDEQSIATANSRRLVIKRQIQWTVAEHPYGKSETQVKGENRKRQPKETESKDILADEEHDTSNDSR